MSSRKELMALRLHQAQKVVQTSPMMLARQGYPAKVFADTVKEAILANPEILNCTEGSFAQAIRKCCRDGIVPDGDSGALVGMKRKQADGNYLLEAVAMPMVQGLKRMAFESLKAEIRSGAIYSTDEVRIVQGAGLAPSIEIIAKDVGFFTANQKAEVVGAYCLLKLPHEEHARLTLFRKVDIDRARAASRAKKGPWVVWPDRMAEKSAVKSAINALRYMKNENNEDLFATIAEDNEVEYGKDVIEGTATDVTGEGEGEGKPEVKVNQGQDANPSDGQRAATKEEQKKNPPSTEKPQEQKQEQAKQPAAEGQQGSGQAKPQEQRSAEAEWMDEGQGTFLPQEGDDDDTAL